MKLRSETNYHVFCPCCGGEGALIWSDDRTGAVGADICGECDGSGIGPDVCSPQVARLHIAAVGDSDPIGPAADFPQHFDDAEVPW